MAKKEIVPNPELRKIALDFYKPPFRFDHLGGYIWALGDKSTHGNQMFADLDAAKERCARIRGWGALQYLEGVDPEALQDECGVMFAEALTEYWDRKQNTIEHVLKPVLEDQGESFNKMQEWIENQGNGAKCHVISRVKPGLKVGTAHEHFDYFMQVDLPFHGICALLKEGDKITLLQGRVFVDIAPQVPRPGWDMPISIVLPKSGDTDCPGLDAFRTFIGERFGPGSSMVQTHELPDGRMSWELHLVEGDHILDTDVTVSSGDKITITSSNIDIQRATWPVQN